MQFCDEVFGFLLLVQCFVEFGRGGLGLRSCYVLLLFEWFEFNNTPLEIFDVKHEVQNTGGCLRHALHSVRSERSVVFVLFEDFTYF